MSLCLNIVMIIVAITRAAGLHYRGVFDSFWIYLFQQVESCAAVTIISLTAFRSVFVANESAKKNLNPWQASIPKILRKHRKLGSQDQHLADLRIPSATFTGMRTFIRGGDPTFWGADCPFIRLMDCESKPSRMYILTTVSQFIVG